MQQIKNFDQRNWIKSNLNYRKETGSKAWILHRISGIALIGYLFLHIYSLSPLSQGRAAFDAKMQSFTTPVFMFLEWILFAFVLFHSLNGIRIVLVDWADGARYHRQLFKYSVVIGIILFFAMGYIMFSHEISKIFASL
jgi:succinate dehydrogenase / fumarate reductase, cytochrome b subunit